MTFIRRFRTWMWKTIKCDLSATVGRLRGVLLSASRNGGRQNAMATRWQCTKRIGFLVTMAYCARSLHLSENPDFF